MAEEESHSPDVKRRRVAAADSRSWSQNDIRCLTDLPSGILAHAASFLAAPSKALFAIALDDDSAVLSDERSSAIAGNLNTLDFGEIEKEVAKKLTDTDITRVLLCVDAVNTVKRLKLANCTNITGTCLEPLRGSVVIEQIDLSHAGDYRKSVSQQISCDHVLPILDSIIEREGCALMHLHFPSMWRMREERTSRSEFHAFIERYNEMMRGKGERSCFECNTIIPQPGPTGGRIPEWIEEAVSFCRYGTQRNTCYACLKYYCCQLEECSVCGRDCCEGCYEVFNCIDCGNDVCSDCYKYYGCVKCKKEVCPKCIQVRYETEDRHDTVIKCEYCDKCYCKDCYDNEEGDFIHTCNNICNRCDDRCCIECLVRRFRRGQLDCAGCIKAIAPHRILVDENKQLHQKMEYLEAEIAVLRRENEDLRSRK